MKHARQLSMLQANIVWVALQVTTAVAERRDQHAKLLIKRIGIRRGGKRRCEAEGQGEHLSRNCRIPCGHRLCCFCRCCRLLRCYSCLYFNLRFLRRRCELRDCVLVFVLVLLVLLVFLFSIIRNHAVGHTSTAQAQTCR